MYITRYRIHLISGQVIHVSEGRKDREEKDLIERYKDILPEGLLEVAPGSFPTAYIPASSILYISKISEEFAA